MADLVDEGASKKEFWAPHLAIIQGSSGVGKSVFLAYYLARRRKLGVANVAIFHASKCIKSGNGQTDMDEVDCVIWLEEELKINRTVGKKKEEIKRTLSNLDLIFMDGCSMRINLDGFKGVVVLSASPSQYVKNMKDGVGTGRYEIYTMPPVSRDEAMEMADLLEVDKSIVEDNFDHMEGIARHLFKQGIAKKKVDEAVSCCDPKNISDMVTMQNVSNNQNQVAVHSLVLWKMNDMHTRIPTSLFPLYLAMPNERLLESLSTRNFMSLETQ